LFTDGPGPAAHRYGVWWTSHLTSQASVWTRNGPARKLAPSFAVPQKEKRGSAPQPTPRLPRRLCPSRSLYFAALRARCRLVPQSGLSCLRTDKPMATSAPRPERFRLVNAEFTPTTCLPAHAAL